VLRLVYGDFSLLLTGDAGEEAEKAMVNSGQPLQAMVLKAGHHGARTSSNDFFLAAVQPQIVVVSAGAENRFGHPHLELLARADAMGATLLRTDQLGTITLTSNGHQLWWEARD
jgi:competence protein ComEC